MDSLWNKMTPDEVAYTEMVMNLTTEIKDVDVIANPGSPVRKTTTSKGGK